AVGRGLTLAAAGGEQQRGGEAGTKARYGDGGAGCAHWVGSSGVVNLSRAGAHGAPRHDSVVRMCTIPGLRRRCLLQSTSGNTRFPEGEAMAPQRRAG